MLASAYSERDPAAGEMSEEERHLLWTLGKAIAMASVARRAASYSERSKQLQQRIDLAREIHEGVIQRIFGVSLALAGDEPLDREAQRRCALEVQAALSDLRALIQRPLGHQSPPTGVTFAEELKRLTGAHPELHIELRRGDPESVPANLQALSQSVLIEAVRNANKHAAASSVGVTLDQDDGALTLEIRNDGALGRDRAKAGIGLRLATLEALQHGGVLEYGECEPGIWQVRMVAPTA